MKMRVGRYLLLTVISLGVLSAGAYAGHVRQFSAQYLNFDGTEQSTTLAPSTGGQTIYQGSVSVPADVNTLEVTISATGDLLNGGTPVPNSLWLNCQVDGTPCNGGVNSAANSMLGWIPVLTLTDAAQVAATSTTPTTATDNNIHYTWCVPIKPNSGQSHKLRHDVTLSMASGDGVDPVQIEQIHVFVDGSKIAGWNKSNACTEAPVPTPVPTP